MKTSLSSGGEELAPLSPPQSSTPVKVKDVTLAMRLLLSHMPLSHMPLSHMHTIRIRAFC